MKKIIGLIIISILIIILLIWFLKTPIASYIVSKKLKVPVSIEKFSMKKGKILVDGFKMKNPEGYDEKTAFSSKKIIGSYSIDNIKKSPKVIDEIEFTDNYLLISCDSPICSENNWTRIIENISDKESKKTDDDEFVIKKLKFNNLTVDILHLGLVPGNKKRMHFDKIEFSNINSKEGFPTAQIIAALFKNAYLMDYVKDVMDKIKIFDNYFPSFGPLSQNIQEPNL